MRLHIVGCKAGGGNRDTVEVWGLESSWAASQGSKVRPRVTFLSCPESQGLQLLPGFPARLPRSFPPLFAFKVPTLPLNQLLARPLKHRPCPPGSPRTHTCGTGATLAVCLHSRWVALRSAAPHHHHSLRFAAALFDTPEATLIFQTDLPMHCCLVPGLNAPPGNPRARRWTICYSTCCGTCWKHGKSDNSDGRVIAVMEG